MLGIVTTLRKHDVAIAEPNDKEFEDKYEKLACKLGIACVTVRNPLLSCLQKNCIQVYDMARVERYMDRKGHWSWWPLRNADARRHPVYRRVTNTPYPSLYGDTVGQIYPKPVPYPVLCTVDIIHTALPEAYFMIAALNTRPDPFLGVGLNDDTLTVIERWDEPSFR